MRFFALDVETANYDFSSICQIGVGLFENGVLTGTWDSLVNPQGPFHWGNTRIHGITEEMVEDAPVFGEVYPGLKRLLAGNMVVHHTPFDPQAFRKAYTRFDLMPIRIKWIDSARIVRQTWSDFAKTGYNLANVARYLGIEFKHHDALEDAIAAGKIVVEACRQSGRSMEEWFELLKTNR